MHKLINFRKKGKELVFMATCLSILVLLVISPAAASVNNWEFSPQEPVSGDTLRIKGSASPEEKIDVFVTFEKTVPVSGGEFEYVLEDVKIPRGLNNLFKVEARGAKNLNVRVKMIVWITKSSEVSGDVVTVSQSSVPPGTYRIKIDGDVKEGASNVNLKITAFQEIEADSNGDFSYSYNTKAVPSGDFEIKVGSVSKKVTIQPEETSESTSDSSSANSYPAKTELSPSTETESSLSPETKPSLSPETKPSLSPETKPSLSPETKPSLEPTDSEAPEENNDSEVLTPEKNPEEKNIQAQPSKKDTNKSEFLRLFTDEFYLLAGVGAAILVLIIYSRRK
ncbi:hypothetical protein RG963_10765 [Methanosarcina sp. Z-7115]|uniref:Cell surface protein n=1 Tax=Methanosarcina baikalica TaxID=3073890 RepID=A0ABU2D2N9_9EURY|nr:hypothetical protein [Methanosarcina sp. Z-7115]MDR7666249.1 hypothetical protein [Methanosarcina sp. Z-7115]